MRIKLISLAKGVKGGPTSGNFGHRGRPGHLGGSVGGSGRLVFTADLTDRIARSINPFNLLIQPEWEAILRSQGHTAEDIQQAKELLSLHGLSSSQAISPADKRINDEIQAKSALGKTMLDSANIEEVAYHIWQNGAQQRAKDVIAKARDDWDSGYKRNLDAYSSFDEFAKAELWDELAIAAGRKVQLSLYRGGSTTKNVQSWTFSSSGANTGGAGRIKPDHTTTIDAALSQGARILGGINRMMGAPGESEVTLYFANPSKFHASKL